MANETIDTGISKHVGFYSDAAIAGANQRTLYSAGTPGVRSDGTIADGIEAQTRVAWENVFAILDRANMEPKDIVKVVTTMTSIDDIPIYVRVRKELLGDLKPAFMLQVVKQLVKKEFLVEIEVIASAP